MDKNPKSGTIRLFTIFLTFALFVAGCSSMPALPFLPQASKFTCPNLTIGVLIGDDSDPIALEQRDGYDMALQEANADEGLKGCNMQLSFRSETEERDTSQVQQTVRDLVETDQALAILGGTSEAASMHAASLVNYFTTPMILPSAGGSHVLPADNHWAFSLSPNEDTYAQTIATMIKEQLGEGKRVSVLYEDSTFGNDAAVAAVNAIEGQNLVMDGYFTYDASQTDFSEIADQIANIQPDGLYLAFDQPDQVEVILKALKAAQVTIPLTVARAGGFASRSFLWQDAATINPDAESLIIATPWISQANTGAGAEFVQHFEDFTQKTHGAASQPSLYSAEAYKSLKILVSILSTELASDPDFSTQNLQKQRETLRSQLQAYHENTPPWGTIGFTAEGQNQGDIYLQQVFNGSLVTVFPSTVAERAPIISLSSNSK